MCKLKPHSVVLLHEKASAMTGDSYDMNFYGVKLSSFGRQKYKNGRETTSTSDESEAQSK